MKRIVFTSMGLLLLQAVCAQVKKADLLVYNAKIYTVDKDFSIASAMAISNGRIVDIGSTKNLERQYNATQKINGLGRVIYPGFIDAHAHFFGYGESLQRANLVDTKSWDEVLQRLKTFASQKKIAKGEWIRGRGWDQNDWADKAFPTNEKLNTLFPDNPVLITRVDGHAAIANNAALEKAKLQPGQTLTGGSIEVQEGKLTGLLIDNAVDLVEATIPGATKAQVKAALLDAQQQCFSVGLTTVDDCGVGYQLVEYMKELNKTGALKMRIYAMLSDAPGNYAYAWRNGIYKSDRLHVRSFKVYADGALGSRGAALLKPYSDRPDWSGFLLSTYNHFDSVARLLAQKGWQMCTHAIGDSGNRTILGIYAKYLQPGNDRRWRIEHAQVVSPLDFHAFGKYGIVPSVQPTHATSDMYWAGDRLGSERVKGAYAYRQLMQQNGWIPLGTDFPVEDISPFKTFYAAVFRKDAKGWPEAGYQTENALSRQEAIRGMTIWAAKSNFEEKEKGSLEKGKFADFIVLDKDLMTATPEEVLQTKVTATYVGGQRVYGK